MHQNRRGRRRSGRSRNAFGPHGGRAVVPWGVRADKLMANTKDSGGFLKKSLDIPLASGKAVGKFKTVVSLDTSPAVSRSRRRRRWPAPAMRPGSGVWRTRQWRLLEQA